MKQERSDMPRDPFKLKAWTDEQERNKAARHPSPRKGAEHREGREPEPNSEEQDNGYQRR